MREERVICCRADVCSAVKCRHRHPHKEEIGAIVEYHPCTEWTPCGDPPIRVRCEPVEGKRSE
jgi:hypothetical protein